MTDACYERHDNAPNDQTALRAILVKLTGHGRVLHIDVAYLPSLMMRPIADLHPGEGETDPRDAHVIADAARTMPHTLRSVGTEEETLSEIVVLNAVLRPKHHRMCHRLDGIRISSTTAAAWAREVTPSLRKILET